MNIAILNYKIGNLASVQNALVYASKELKYTTITIESNPHNLMRYDKIILPGVGAFGDAMEHLRISGMQEAIIEFAKSGKYMLGICLGMQIAAIEFARNVLGYSDANSSEFDAATTHPVISFLPDQTGNIPKGGTMRLGAYPCAVKKGTKMEKAYQSELVYERHRHRYEFTNEYREEFEKAGMVFSGTSPDGHLVEALEIASHPFFMAVQFHPEFKSRPNRPHPLFRGFVSAAAKLHSSKN